MKTDSIEEISLEECLREKITNDSSKSGYDEFGNYYYTSEEKTDKNGNRYRIVAIE